MNSQKQLSYWYQNNKRQFPWRKVRSPYRVWISEIMLQQTRASVVVEYFNRWMSLFPTIESLAKAPFDQVLKAWEGLGYYSRVRNIHQSAKIVMEKYGGVFPVLTEDILSLPGIGDYTVGAIRSFAYQEKELALDGNTQRVLARFYGIQKPEKKIVKKKGQEFVDLAFNWEIVEALIELGALVCKPKPDCTRCPLRTACVGHQKNVIEKIQLKPSIMTYEKINRFVYVISHQSNFLIHVVKKNKLMEDLAEFPHVDLNKEQFDSKSTLEAELQTDQFEILAELPQILQSYTKYKVKLFPVLVHVSKKLTKKGYKWVSLDKVNDLTFSSGHRKILNYIYEYFASRSFLRVGRTGN